MDWVVDFERKITQQETSKEWGKRSIYRVPASTKKLHKEAYIPLEVSFGPYHCEEQELKKKMDEHKRRALHHFLDNSKKSLKTYVNELQKDVNSLMESYDSLDVKYWKEDIFLQMMLLDGCFMLEILRANEEITKPGNTYGMYDNAKDPIFSYHGKVYMMPHFRRDMLMLENQLPMLLLHKLLSLEGVIEGDQVNYLNKLIFNFVNPRYHLPSDDSFLHVLDLYRKSLLGNGQSLPPTKMKPPGNTQNAADIVRSAEKLHEAGIDFKSSQNKSIMDISFDCGKLKLPTIVVDDMTESTFLNLMVFERLHVGAGNEVTSFVSFMDNIIDTANDVRILHSCGIIHNAVGSEKAVANIFNGISKDLTPDPEGRLEKVHDELDGYCNIARNAYRAHLKRNYFKNPWALISLLAAIILMMLTIAQTIYSIIGYHHPTK
ncbi:hypothetical protein ACHQM5_025972 [Ranunculus cassubicifolius]